MSLYSPTLNGKWIIDHVPVFVERRKFDHVRLVVDEFRRGKIDRTTAATLCRCYRVPVEMAVRILR